MEIVEIVGYREVDFTDERGKQVVGRSYYYVAPSEGVVGKNIGKLWIPVIVSVLLSGCLCPAILLKF